jgi:hypothetical protein
VTSAFLGEPGTDRVLTIRTAFDSTGPLLVMVQPSGAEVTLSGAYGPGPLALLAQPC